MTQLSAVHPMFLEVRVRMGGAKQQPDRGQEDVVRQSILFHQDYGLSGPLRLGLKSHIDTCTVSTLINNNVSNRYRDERCNKCKKTH